MVEIVFVVVVLLFFVYICIGCGFLVDLGIWMFFYKSYRCNIFVL